MIVFLNFAPTQFLGGAERKMIEMYDAVREHEDSKILSVDKSIADIYGRIVLGRKFDIRLKKRNGDFISLSLKAFLPFTREQRSVKEVFSDARVIYFKAEFLEAFILIYFLGIDAFGKSIAAIRSPWFYESPISISDHIHNVLYKSPIVGHFLKKCKGVHVMTSRVKNELMDNYNLKNVFVVPNTIDLNQFKPKLSSKTENYNRLDVVFVGELVLRKGIDRLVDVIENSPQHFHFHIAGDGPWKEKIVGLAKKKLNVEYYGYLSPEEVGDVMSSSDVLLLPSRAEGYAGVIHEAMVHGLRIVDSKECAVGLPSYIESTCENNLVKDYIFILESMYQEKKIQKASRKKIRKYCIDNFSTTVLLPKIIQNSFSIHI